MMVKLGMKSVPGKISSIKFPIPPKAPFHPPNVIKKIIAETGAQMISANSPKTGIAYVAQPMRSITKQNTRDGWRRYMSQRF